VLTPIFQLRQGIALATSGSDVLKWILKWGLLRQRRPIDGDCQENKVRMLIKFTLRSRMNFSRELRDEPREKDMLKRMLLPE
jgi:hypothetical protein